MNFTHSSIYYLFFVSLYVFYLSVPQTNRVKAQFELIASISMGDEAVNRSRPVLHS